MCNWLNETFGFFSNNLQNIFYIVSLIGIIIAASNHFWFLKDRRVGNIIALKNHVNKPMAVFISETDETKKNVALFEFLSALIVYCQLSNQKLISAGMRKIMKHSIASSIQELVNDDGCLSSIKLVSNKDVFYKPIRDYITKNKKLFNNPTDVISKFE